MSTQEICLNCACNQQTCVDGTGLTAGKCGHAIPLAEEERNNWNSQATQYLHSIVWDKLCYVMPVQLHKELQVLFFLKSHICNDNSTMVYN